MHVDSPTAKNILKVLLEFHDEKSNGTTDK